MSKKHKNKVKLCKKKTTAIEYKCKECGKVFEAGRTRDRKYCSYECYHQSIPIKVPKGKFSCCMCKQVLSFSCFYKDVSSTTGHAKRCKDCSNLVFRERKLLKSYGITLEDYDKMLKEQHGVCNICGRKETQMNHGVIRPLSVDHNHITGRVRGLLCSKCNSGLGFLGDNEYNLERAIKHLKEDPLGDNE